MQQREISQEEGTTYCLRHPQTETRLQCGRCGDYICPRCMVTSPVGARCPDCARIGRPKALDTSRTEMGRAVLAGLLAAAAGAIALSLILWVIPFVYLSLPGMAAIGYLVGEAVRIGSGNKLDNRLKYVAATCTFVSWAMAVLLVQIFGVNPVVVAGIMGIAGMIAGIYISMFRVRVP